LINGIVGSVCVLVPGKPLFNLFAVYTFYGCCFCPQKLYNEAYEQCAQSQKMSPVIRATQI